MLVGFGIAAVIVLTLASVFLPVEIPPEYKATYGWRPEGQN